MKNIILVTAVLTSLLAGCASVDMESKEASSKAKEFQLPKDGNAGLYIYRAGGVGASLKKDVWLNEKCIGETAPHMFFYQSVPGGVEHKLSTESEFSPNDLVVKTESGQNYFVKQYIKMGVFVGGAKLELVSSEKGKEQVSKLELAKQGSCSK